MTLFARFRSSAFLIGSYQDDFFYYLKVAQNIAATGRSTFNGLNLTNGYHPLWMLVLVVLCALFRGTAFFLALQTVSLASAALVYGLMRRTLFLYLPQTEARVGAFALGLEALMLIRYGMEVTLTLPLAMLLVYLLLRDGVPQTFRQSAGLGLLSALVILSRLDSGLLVALVAVAVLPKLLKSDRCPTTFAGFCFGVLPLLCFYFGLNLHVFHLLTPVSGLAKQMKQGTDFSPETWRSLLPNNRMRGILLLPQLLLVAAGVGVLCFAREGPNAKLPRETRNLVRAVLLFPLVHLALLSYLSDWNVWPWYYYSITLAAFVAYLLLTQIGPRRAASLATFGYAALLVVYTLAYAWKGPDSIAVYQSSLETANYMDLHPGVYMMGDQAGTTAFLAHQPIVQAEGLVMDKQFLANMRAGTPLSQVAQMYGAEYYAKIGGDYQGGCLPVAEPANAGPESRHMRGTICHLPLAVFYRGADHMPIRIFQSSWIH